MLQRDAIKWKKMTMGVCEQARITSGGGGGIAIIYLRQNLTPGKRTTYPSANIRVILLGAFTGPERGRSLMHAAMLRKPGPQAKDHCPTSCSFVCVTQPNYVSTCRPALERIRRDWWILEIDGPDTRQLYAFLNYPIAETLLEEIQDERKI